MSTVPPVDKAMLAQTEDMLLTSEYLTDLLSRHSISPMEWYFMPANEKNLNKSKYDKRFCTGTKT